MRGLVMTPLIAAALVAACHTRERLPVERRAIPTAALEKTLEDGGCAEAIEICTGEDWRPITFEDAELCASTAAICGDDDAIIRAIGAKVPKPIAEKVTREGYWPSLLNRVGYREARQWISLRLAVTNGCSTSACVVDWIPVARWRAPAMVPELERRADELLAAGAGTPLNATGEAKCNAALRAAEVLERITPKTRTLNTFLGQWVHDGVFRFRVFPSDSLGGMLWRGGGTAMCRGRTAALEIVSAAPNDVRAMTFRLASESDSIWVVALDLSECSPSSLTDAGEAGTHCVTLNGAPSLRIYLDMRAHAADPIEARYVSTANRDVARLAPIPRIGDVVWSR